MLIGRKHKEALRKEQSKEKQLTTFKFPLNLELNTLNEREIKYEAHTEYDTLLVHFEGEIRVHSLTDMKVERIIENVPRRIHSVGVYSEGVYAISSTRRDYQLIFYDRDGVSEPRQITVDSRIQAHLSFEIDLVPLVALLCADNMLRVYDAITGVSMVEKHIH